MGKAEFTKLSKLITKVTRTYNMERQVTGALVCHHFREIAKETWNDAVEESISPVSFKEGILQIRVVDSGWAQQVQFHRAEILERLRAQSEKITIKDLRIRVGA